LKNVGNRLPLNAPKSIGIIGNGAADGSKGPNGQVSKFPVTCGHFLIAILRYTDRGGDDGVLAMGKLTTPNISLGTYFNYFFQDGEAVQ
jgi:beta-glucosidase